MTRRADGLYTEVGAIKNGPRILHILTAKVAPKSKSSHRFG